MIVKLENAARKVDLHPATLRKLIRLGKLPCYRVGRLIRIDEAELKATLRKEARTWNRQTSVRE